MIFNFSCCCTLDMSNVVNPKQIDIIPRHSFTTRLLYTCIPSQMYANDTLDTLLDAMVEDLEHLHLNGLEAA